MIEDIHVGSRGRAGSGGIWYGQSDPDLWWAGERENGGRIGV